MNKKILILIIALAIILGSLITFYFISRKGKVQKTSEISPSPAENNNFSKEAKIIIRTKPENAQASISAFYSSFIEEKTCPCNFSVPVQKLYLIVSYPKYGYYTQEIEIKKGETKEINVILEYTGKKISEGAPIDNQKDANPNNLIPNP